jgi:hypothetical protein
LSDTYQFQQSEESAGGYPIGNATGSRNAEGRTMNDSGKLKTMTTDPGDESADILMFLLEERKTEPWQQTFTLPHNVDMKALKVRLEGGLLMVDIPTRDASGEPGIKVEIE